MFRTSKAGGGEPCLEDQRRKGGRFPYTNMAGWIALFFIVGILSRMIDFPVGQYYSINHHLHIKVQVQGPRGCDFELVSFTGFFIVAVDGSP